MGRCYRQSSDQSAATGFRAALRGASCRVDGDDCRHGSVRRGVGGVGNRRAYQKTFIREPFRMTNMDSSIFHKEENNESKTMDGGDRCGSHTVCVRNRAAGAMAEEATAPSTPATSTTCATNGNTVTVKGTDADAFKTWNGKDLFEQPHVQSGEKSPTTRSVMARPAARCILRRWRPRRRAFFRRCKN